ncbi:MAG: PIN domain-containing protein [Syntrophales bacterium]|nr:PIN domain-containing protein [Syntrophales bacterium]
MKNKGILPDTCAWIDYFRSGTAPQGQVLDQALSAETVYVCGPVLYELVQGAKSEKEQSMLINALGALPYLEMNEVFWIKAGQLSSALRQKGKTIPFSDILIAALALEHNLAVLTIDDHFQDIPGLTLRPIPGG